VRVALDTNVLAYAEGINGAERRDAALALIRQLPQDAAVVPAQVLGELFNVLVRKGGRSRGDARDAPLGWRDALPVVEASPEMMLAAADLAEGRSCGGSSGRFPDLIARQHGVEDDDQLAHAGDDGDLSLVCPWR
jgi:predicted nucleic acid-binding protein